MSADSQHLQNVRLSGSTAKVANARLNRTAYSLNARALVLRRSTWTAFILVGGLFASLWFPALLGIGNFSVTFALPFVLAGLLFPCAAQNKAFFAMVFPIRGVGLSAEVVFALVIAFFAATSMLNSAEPVRAFRVIVAMLYVFPTIIIVAACQNLFGAYANVKIFLTIVLSSLCACALLIAIYAFPPTTRVVSGAYRLRGFFDNANQLSLFSASVIPLAVSCWLYIPKTALKFLSLISVALLVVVMMLTGGKTAIALSVVSTAAIFIVGVAYSRDVVWALLSSISIFIGGTIVAIAAPAILKFVSPITYGKFLMIFRGGVENYQSFISRQALWDEAIRTGWEHPILGSGAGTHILGLTHAHNLILDYFRGTGLFGAGCAVALCLFTLVRTIWACCEAPNDGDVVVARRLGRGALIGASVYVLGNQLSDSFSPSTAALFWLLLASGVTTTLNSVQTSRHGRAPVRQSWGADAATAARFSQHSAGLSSRPRQSLDI